MGGESGRIESWKAIAEYLRRDVKTAMRWHRERALPVRRIPGEKRSGVYAFISEIDAWLETERSVDLASRPREAEKPGEVGGSATPPENRVEVALPSVSLSVTAGRRSRRASFVGLALVGLVGLLAAATSARKSPVYANALRADGATLEALDSGGRVLWSRVFPAPFPTPKPNTAGADGHELANRSWIGDLDGDGDTEVLFIAAQSANEGDREDTLYCFDSAGKERWSFRLTDTYAFKGREFGPPWRLGRLAVYEVDGEKRIAMSLGHWWWPAPLLTFNPRGERLTTFVSSGHIYQLRTAVRDGKPLILAAGVSNSHEAASLIVLDGRNPTGTTPEERGSPFECLSCPKGRPLRAFFFPRTEIAAAAGRPYNSAKELWVSGSEIRVQVLEVADYAQGRANKVLTSFEFDSAFRLVESRWSDEFRPQHVLYEEAGVLKHTVEACPERVPAVRFYDPERGLVPMSLRN